MDALEQLALTGNVVARSLRASLAPPLAIVVLAALAVPALVTSIVAWFAHPALSAWAVPVVRALGGEPALHYPGNFVLLPGVLARIARATTWLALPLAVAWAATLAAHGRRGVSAAAAFAATVQHLALLVVVGAPLAFLHGTVAAMSAAVAQGGLGSPIRLVAHLGFSLVSETAVLGVCALVLPVLVQEELPLREAPFQLRRALRLGTVAPFALGGALALSALAGRVLIARQVRAFAADHPEAVVPGVLEAALLTALGIIVLAAGSVTLAAALDEGWRE